MRLRPIALVPVHQTAPDFKMRFTKLEGCTDCLRVREATGEQTLGATAVSRQSSRSGTHAK